MALPPYGPPIRDAIASANLAKMKAMEKKVSALIKSQGDLHSAFVELQEAIKKLESSKNK